MKSAVKPKKPPWDRLRRQRQSQRILFLENKTSVLETFSTCFFSPPQSWTVVFIPAAIFVIVFERKWRMDLKFSLRYGWYDSLFNFLPGEQDFIKWRKVLPLQIWAPTGHRKLHSSFVGVEKGRVCKWFDLGRNNSQRDKEGAFSVHFLLTQAYNFMLITCTLNKLVRRYTKLFYLK
jgi:hypothetical protein